MALFPLPPTRGIGPRVTCMSLIFWIIVGIAFAAILIGLVLKARLSDEEVWKELVDPNAAQDDPQLQPIAKPDVPGGTNMSVFSDQSSKPHWDANTPTSPKAIPSSPREIDLRRSSRVERGVPLLVLATNRRGETFQERTSAVAVNLHGCRYASRHDYAPESWVTLQVTGTDGASSSVVRARVRSVVSAQSLREFSQVGVELETPGNIWGIPVPPDDWHGVLSSNNSASATGAAVSPAERRAEVTVFPGQAGPTNAAEASTPRDSESGKHENVNVTAEQILMTLQEQLHPAANEAVQTALSVRLDESVKSTLAKIEEGWRDNLRQIEEYSATRLAEAQNRWEKELVVYHGRAEEVARRLEALTANTQQALAETQKFIERFANEIAPQLQARLNDSYAHASSEFEARVAQMSAQQLKQLTESTQNATREARSQLDSRLAEMHSLVASNNGGPSKENLEGLINSFRKQTLDSVEERLGQFYVRSSQQYDLARDRAEGLTRQLETLAAEMRQARSQHEQSLAEVRSLMTNANANAGVPQERLDSLMNSTRQEILSHLEWRLGEVSGHHEELIGQAQSRAGELARQVESLSGETRAHLTEIKDLAERAVSEVSEHYENLVGQSRVRTDELARQVEGLSGETRGQLMEIKELAERAVSEVQSQDIAAIQQSVSRATQEFETAAARVSDRQLARLIELKQAVSRETSLELEARASEARAVLQSTANSTMEEIRRRVEDQTDTILAEATERATSAISSLDAESRAACQARYRSLEGEVAMAAEQAAMEFRTGIKAFLYSCLVAAVSAVDQHTQTTLTGLANEPNSLPAALGAISAPSVQAEEPVPPREDLPAPPVG